MRAFDSLLLPVHNPSTFVSIRPDLVLQPASFQTKELSCTVSHGDRQLVLCFPLRLTSSNAASYKVGKYHFIFASTFIVAVSVSKQTVHSEASVLDA